MSKTKRIPVPTKGWTTAQPIDDMKTDYAIELVNFIPTPTGLELRQGYRAHAQTYVPGAVQTLVEYFDKDGVKKLIAAAGGSIFDVSAYATLPTTLGTGFTNNRWQTVTFKNTLILVNGSDQPQKYTTAAGLLAADYTGITDDAVFIQASVYNERLYFVQKNSTSIWYAGAASITGAVTELDVGRQLRRGGYIVWAGSFTKDTGVGVSDMFVVLSSTGEVIIYTGSYPGGSDWARVGRQYLSSPLGVRAVANVASDLLFLTDSGVQRESTLLSDTLGVAAQTDLSRATAEINDAFREIAALAKNNIGWEICTYPKGAIAIVNIPLATDTQSEQYVMHMITGGWCRFTGIDASCWCVYDDALYFGGKDGVVYIYSGNMDAGEQPISAYFRTAFNYLGDPNSEKKMLLIQPIMRSDGGTGVTMDIGADFEFAITNEFETTASIEGTSGSYWDYATWDTASWEGVLDTIADWQQLKGIGRAVSIKGGADFRQVDLTLSGINVMFQQGGRL